MSFQNLSWLQKLGLVRIILSQSGVVGRCVQHLTDTHMTLY